MYTDKFAVRPNSKVDLSKIRTGYTDKYKSKSEANDILKKNIKKNG